MPRPGPRPYECVKRAWHSDRHQPIRGSIIRQIFRLAMEAHSGTTRKNKEWQEKLPIVVLKAEEIIYSKANSEEEYTDVDTMWNRVNDAIDTIIRRDESTETGPLLPPCVEAALNLGCIAIRASRSQRHSNVRTYLSPKLHEPTNDHPEPLKSEKPANPVDNSDNQVAAASPLRGYPFLHESMQMHQKPLATTPAPVNFGSVYPLYYGCNSDQNQQVDTSFPLPEAPPPVIIGTPIGVKAHREATERVCDLSLRLGMSSESSARVDGSASRGRNREGDLCLFSEVKKKKDDTFERFSSNSNSSRIKKHKTFSE